MTTAERITVADFMALPDDGYLHELVRGEIVRMPPPSGEHGRIEFRLARFIDRFLDQQARAAGWQGFDADAQDRLVGYVAGGEAGVQFSLPDDPDQVRGVDVCYLTPDQVARYEEIGSTGSFREVPALVAEVISPSERAAYIDEKVSDYLQGGARLVWLLFPSKRTVRVFRADSTTATMASDGVLDGEDVLPGFSVGVAGLFPLPPNPKS